MNRRQMLRSAGLAAAASVNPVQAPDAAARIQGGSIPRVGPAGPFVTTADGNVLFYRDWGTGQPILFLAAWALPSDMWAYQMVPLSESGFRTIAFDRRGHGGSTDAAGRYDFDTLADDLAAIINTLDLHNVVLVGMSMAAGEIVRYLSRHGSARIARLVLVAPAATPFLMRTPDNPSGIPGDVFDTFRSTALLRDYPRWIEENRAPFFTASTSREMQEWIRGMMLTTSMKALVECNRSSTSTDFRAELRRIDRPTLIVHGDRDVSAPLALTGKPTAALIPSARLEVYEGAPHGLFVTHMERLTRDIAGFAPS